MVYIFAILLLIIVALALIYFHGVRVKALISIDQEICIQILWMYPFIKAIFALEETIPVLKIFLFNLRIFKLRMKNKKERTMNLKRLAQSICASHIKIKTIYNMDNPFMTGIMCGTFNALFPFLDIEKITHIPDFLSNKQYIRTETEALINVRDSILNFAKNNSKKEIYQWSKT